MGPSRQEPHHRQTDEGLSVKNKTFFYHFPQFVKGYLLDGIDFPFINLFIDLPQVVA